MSDENLERYLWDGGGAPDPEVQRLERLLGRYKYVAPVTRRARPWLWTGLLAAAGLAAVVFVPRFLAWSARGSYRVEGLAGLDRVHVGESFETGAGEATLFVASIGDVDVGPGSRVRVETIADGAHHLFLEKGRIRASILAAPEIFQVGTPAGWSIDLGCEYDLVVDDGGSARLTVRTGRVAFRAGGREVLLPRGFRCETVPGQTPSVPVRVDAPALLVDAVRSIENAADPDPELVALVTDVDATPIRDHSVTLWHLFVYGASEAVRDAAFANLARAYPLPPDVDAATVRACDEKALAAWREIVQRDWPGGWLEKGCEEL